MQTLSYFARIILTFLRKININQEEPKMTSVPVPRTAELKQLALDHLWMPYTQWQELAQAGGPTIIASASGCRMTDSDGMTYLDGISALEAAVAGHGRPEIVEAVTRQLQTLSFLDVFRYASETQIRLAAKLAEITPGDLSRVHFSPGGSEADEVAIKMARQYHLLNGEAGRYKVISRWGAYHGCTMAMMAVDGSYFSTRKQYYEPLPPLARHVQAPYSYRCSYNCGQCNLSCADELEQLILRERPETISAFLLDPCSTAIGVAIPPPDYLPRVREICDRYGILMIADEVISGFGRTGKMFACQHWGVVPDIMALSKGISSGYQPLGATVASQKVAGRFVGGVEATFSHGQTYAGHPAACAAALANIEILEQEQLADRAAEMGAYLLEGLRSLSHHLSFGEARGLGLLCGLEVVQDRDRRRQFQPAGSAGKRLRLLCKERGLITLALHPGDVLLFAPPLIITRSEIEELVGIVDQSLTAFEKETGLV
jgi:adenosylmethionine-8-amino-7-oxononanoate aminotransferase